MADPYWRYAPGSAPDRGVLSDVPRAAFPGYMNTDSPFLSAHHLRATSSDYLQKDILPIRPGAYGEIAGLATHSAPGLSGAVKGLPIPIDDPAVISQRLDVPQGINRGIPDIINERPSSLMRADGMLGEESGILFIDGLPSDCTRREVSHLFRPFIGFQEIRLVHKEPRHARDKAMVLCFVEFSDAKCALTAMEALQGYKFDNKKPDAPSLKIQFAKFPFRPPSM